LDEAERVLCGDAIVASMTVQVLSPWHLTVHEACQQRRTRAA
jgi:hypothetical protein